MVLPLWVVENRPSPLLWPLAYTTACTTVQAVIDALYKFTLSVYLSVYLSVGGSYYLPQISSKSVQHFCQNERNADVGTGHRDNGTDIGATGHDKNIIASAMHSVQRHKNAAKNSQCHVPNFSEAGAKLDQNLETSIVWTLCSLILLKEVANWLSAVLITGCIDYWLVLIFGWRFSLVVTCVGLDQRSFSTLGPVSAWMGDRLRASKLSRYITSHPGHLSLAIPLCVYTSLG